MARPPPGAPSPTPRAAHPRGPRAGPPADPPASCSASAGRGSAGAAARAAWGWPRPAPGAAARPGRALTEVLAPDAVVQDVYDAVAVQVGGVAAAYGAELLAPHAVVADIDGAVVVDVPEHRGALTHAPAASLYGRSVGRGRWGCVTRPPCWDGRDEECGQYDQQRDEQGAHRRRRIQLQPTTPNGAGLATEPAAILRIDKRNGAPNVTTAAPNAPYSRHDGWSAALPSASAPRAAVRTRAYWCSRCAGWRR